MKPQDQVLSSVLSRNGFNIEWSEKSVYVKRSESRKSPVNLYLSFSIIIALIGVLSLLYFSLLFGVILLSSSIPLYLKVNKLNQREKDNVGEFVEITENKLVFGNKVDKITLKRDNIEQINYHMERDKDISVGSIEVVTEDQNIYELFDIYGEDKRYVEDDAKIIVNKFVAILNE